MQIILREDVPSLGKAGEVVKVAEGYGRNFLLPRKKAVVANASSLKQLETERQSIETKRNKLRKDAEDLGGRIQALTMTLAKQAGEEDKIFGSVSAVEIAQYLTVQGITVDKRLIRIKVPIRTLGEHVVEVHLHGDVVVPLKIQVIKG